MNFERNKDPKASMGIGEVNRRVFDNTDEAAEWFAKYPAAYTDGAIHDWGGKNFSNGEFWFDRPTGKFNHRASGEIGKLRFVKWVKENIHFSKYPEAIIGLKESKIIVDTAEEIIGRRLFKETNFPNQTDLENMEQYIRMIQNQMLEDTKSMDYQNGFREACGKMKRFIKNIKKYEA